METTITVQGDFSVRHPAERAVVRLSAGFDGAEREPVLTDTLELHRALTEQLARLTDPAAGPVTWWASDQVRVWGARPWNQEGEQLQIVYHSALDIDVRFSDFLRLSEWVGEVSLINGVTINGIGWELTEPKRRSLIEEAQRLAVENAVAKATIYATSVGLSSVRPVALSDPGLLGDSSTSRSPATAYGSSRMMAAGAPELALKPEEISIDVQVHARFIAT